MQYMVIERFKDADAVRKRFKEKGRMMPEGLRYISSWIDANTQLTCYQLMETEDPTLLDKWTETWSDIVDFQISPVLSSAEFNAK